MLSGGKVIGTGTYSCIFDPPLRCKSQTKQPKGHIISKLILEDEADVEWSISNRISKIPLWRNYFSVSESICEPAEAQKDQEIYTKCELLQEYDLNQLRILNMKYAGKAIQSYTFPETFELMPFIIHILEAGALMTLHQLVHFDLHSGNILIDDNQTPRMIDFNLSIMAGESIPESQLAYRFSRNYHLPQQPPEYTAVLGVNQGKDIQKIIHTIMSKPVIRSMQALLNIPLGKIQNDLQALINQNTFVARGDITGWFYTHWMKNDSWALGAYFIDMIRRFSMHAPISNGFEQNRAKLVVLLSRLSAIDPVKRWDCIQALHYMKPTSVIIKKYSANWLQKYGYPSLRPTPR